MSQSSEVPEGEFQVQLNWGPFEFLYLQHLPLDGGCTCSGGGGASKGKIPKDTMVCKAQN